MLFVHGAGNEHSVWALQSRYFAHHGFNAVAVDLPAHGRSDGAALASVEALADWIRDFADAALAGEAWRSSAIRWDRSQRSSARRAIPERVTKLALLGPPRRCRFPKRCSTPRSATIASPASSSPAGPTVRGKQIGGSQVPGLWLTGNALRLLERTRPGVLSRRSRRVQSVRVRAEASAAKVRCPALAIVGARDLMAPSKNAQAR